MVKPNGISGRRACRVLQVASICGTVSIDLNVRLWPNQEPIGGAGSGVFGDTVYGYLFLLILMRAEGQVRKYKGTYRINPALDLQGQAKRGNMILHKRYTRREKEGRQLS